MRVSKQKLLSRDTRTCSVSVSAVAESGSLRMATSARQSARCGRAPSDSSRTSASDGPPPPLRPRAAASRSCAARWRAGADAPSALLIASLVNAAACERARTAARSAA